MFDGKATDFNMRKDWQGDFPALKLNKDLK